MDNFGVQFDEEPIYEPLRDGVQPESKSEIIKILKDKNILKDEKMAQMILLGISILIFIIAGLVFFFAAGNRSIFKNEESLPNEAFIIQDDGKLYQVQNGKLQEVQK